MKLKQALFLSTAFCFLTFGSLGCFVEPRACGIGFSDPSKPDDVQYFAPGPEFKLSREAAAKKGHVAEEELRER